MRKEFFTASKYSDLWKFFIGAFKDADDKDRSGFGTYYNQILAMRNTNASRFVMDFADLETYVAERQGGEDSEPIDVLRDLALDEIDTARLTLRDAVSSLLAEAQPEYHAEVEKNLQADFKGMPTVKEIPDLNIDDVDRPINLNAIIMEADERGRAELVKSAWQCRDGHITYSDDEHKPPHCAQTFDDDEGKLIECDNQYLKEVKKLHQWVDYIEVKAQQRLDHIDEKKTSVDIEMKATGRDNTRFVVKKLRLADYTTINGVVRLNESRYKGHGSKKLGDLYIEVMDIEIKPESLLTEYDPAYAGLVPLAVTEDNEDPDYEKLIRSVCPSYQGAEHDVIKEALLLLSVGSDQRKNRDGSRLRGEIQILLLGDKGTAKSLLLKWIKNIRPRAFYTSGSKTSAVSLVGGMKAEDPSRPARVFVGIFGIADLVIIDELEKRKPEELDALAEPMQDSQSLHIGRRGENREQDIEVAVLAGANPADKLAKYDITKDIFTNTKLPAWLLDRFDCIFIMRDVPNRSRDEALFSHIVHTRKESKTRQQFESGKHDFKRLSDDYYPVGYMKQWTQYVRDTFHPAVADSPEALEIIHKFFNEYRKLNIRQPKSQEERDNWSKDYEMPAVQWRTLQSLLRFAEASARAHHRHKVLPKDAEIAVNIIRTSIASSGMNNFSEIKMEEAEVNEIESRMNDVAQRAVIRKQYRDANYDAKVFSEGLARLSWKKCEECHGDGFKFDVNERIVCDVCEMAGGTPEAFDYSMLQEYCQSRRVLPKAFELMWKRCLVEKLIEPDKSMPGLYHNKRKDTGIIRFADTMRPQINFQDADSLYLKAVRAKNEPLREYIDKISDSQEYE